MENSIKIQLTVPQLEILFPEGSEARASLTSGVISNYTEILAKRIVDKLNSLRTQVMNEAFKKIETVSYGVPALTPETKERIRYDAIRSYEEQAKKHTINVLQELKIDEYIKNEVYAEIQRRISTHVNSFNIKDHVRGQIIQTIKEELLKMNMKDVLTDNIRGK